MGFFSSLCLSFKIFIFDVVRGFLLIFFILKVVIGINITEADEAIRSQLHITGDTWHVRIVVPFHYLERTEKFTPDSKSPHSPSEDAIEVTSSHERLFLYVSCSSPRWDNLPSEHQRNPFLGLFGRVHVLGSIILF